MGTMKSMKICDDAHSHLLPFMAFMLFMVPITTWSERANWQPSMCFPLAPSAPLSRARLFHHEWTRTKLAKEKASQLESADDTDDKDGASGDFSSAKSADGLRVPLPFVLT